MKVDQGSRPPPGRPGEPHAAPRRYWSRAESIIASGAALVLCWACYDYGAFLRPARPVVAATIPALGLLWLGFRLLRRGDHPLRLGFAEWSLLLLGLLGAASAAWSLDTTASLQAAGILFGGLFFLVLGRDLGTTSSRMRSLSLYLLSGLGSLVSVLAIIGYALRYWRFAMVQEETLLATGTFGYANALAGLLLLTLACTTALCFEGRPGRPTRARIVVILAIVAVQLAALGLSRSRAAAAIVGLTVVLFFILRAFSPSGTARVRRLVGVALSVLLVCALVTGGVLVWKEVAPQLEVSGLPPAGADPDDIVPMTSNSFRIKTWAAALEATGERPILGYGLGTFYEAYSPFKLGAHTAYAHNVIVQHLVELGALGTILLLVFVAMAIFRRARIPVGRLLHQRRVLLLGASAFLLHNLVDLTWYFPALFYIFTLVLGLAASYGPGLPRTGITRGAPLQEGSSHQETASPPDQPTRLR